MFRRFILKYLFNSRITKFENAPEPNTKSVSRKLSRSLSFCSLLPLSSKRGKLKISKFGSNLSLNRVVENTECALNKKISEHFSEHNKDNLKGRVLEDIDEADSAMKRLSIVEDEIERFEREFVIPMNKSVSSSNLSEAPRPRRPKRSHLRGLNKYYSTDSVGSSKLGKMRQFYSSSDSVISEYDSGAYSRESTPDPDFSLKSSMTDTSEPLVSPRLVITSNKNIANADNVVKDTNEDNPKVSIVIEIQNTDHKTNNFDRFAKQTLSDYQSVTKDDLFSSTPKLLTRKPVLSKSQSLLWTKTPTILKRSTTSVGFSRSTPVSMATRTARCSVDCRSQVTVNGMCFH